MWFVINVLKWCFWQSQYLINWMFSLSLLWQCLYHVGPVSITEGIWSIQIYSLNAKLGTLRTAGRALVGMGEAREEVRKAAAEGQRNWEWRCHFNSKHLTANTFEEIMASYSCPASNSLEGSFHWWTLTQNHAEKGFWKMCSYP